MATTTSKIEFSDNKKNRISARLEMPLVKIRGYALFAHCFTCSKEFQATRWITEKLAEQGIAVMRFDFTGLGKSEGEFAATNFSTNIEDLLSAAQYMRENLQAPQILIGHSLGGAAVISTANDIPEVKAVVTIGAPADAEHVAHNFAADIDAINEEGEVEVTLAGRKFNIRKQFLDDLKAHSVKDKASQLNSALMVMHSPVDSTVGIENAQEIFIAARHPKSFVSLDKADHLLFKKKDAEFVAEMIASWSERYIDDMSADDREMETEVLVAETGLGKFHNFAYAGNHMLIADEPKSVGGFDSGPTPYDYLSVALGACTNMTLRMYVDFKKLDLGKISVTVDHKKLHINDCEDCVGQVSENKGKIDRFERNISVEGEIDASLREKLLEIADKCPVHKTLEANAHISTNIRNSE